MRVTWADGLVVYVPIWGSAQDLINDRTVALRVAEEARNDYLATQREQRS
jgi:hypothetical protein